MEEPPKKFFRLGPGREIRLKGGYIIKCEDYKKNEATGEIEEIYCTYDSDTKSGTPGSQRKVKGLLHWVSVSKAIDAEVRLYDRLFLDENPLGHKDKDFLDFINPDSLNVITAKIEPSLASAKAGDAFQFQRIGYFNIDQDSTAEKLVFNRTVGLRDSWGRKKQ
jgi:glutaminyl-tRNA synthetase